MNCRPPIQWLKLAWAFRFPDALHFDVIDHIKVYKDMCHRNIKQSTDDQTSPLKKATEFGFDPPKLNLNLWKLQVARIRGIHLLDNLPRFGH